MFRHAQHDKRFQVSLRASGASAAINNQRIQKRIQHVRLLRATPSQ
ncbi:MAG: hypothetical protein K2N54_02660 [Helicobacter sp.]|nr:hypothetical protein [Helicobacter sp.]